VMELLGRANWWLPGPLARVLPGGPAGGPPAAGGPAGQPAGIEPPAGAGQSARAGAR
jgi:hypothetical protein